jgi:hypothetical protein
MNLYSYIASMNPRKANVLLRNNGFGEGKTTSEIEARLKQYVREEREEAMREVAKIHPDKELLIGDGVNSELLNYTGRERHRNFNGQEFLQDLDTTTYYGPNANQNPYRPIAPDFFNNAIGVSQQQFPMNKSMAEGITKDDLKEAVKTAVTEAKASETTPEPKTASVLSFSQQEVVMMLGFAFLGYLIAKKGL